MPYNSLIETRESTLDGEHDGVRGGSIPSFGNGGSIPPSPNSISPTHRTPMISPYNIVPGTQIVHNLTDVYELTDELEEMVYRVELNADNDGVYIRSSEKGIEEGSKNITEDMSIGNKELSICIAKRILELYGVN
jgi:hypothetical protein